MKKFVINLSYKLLFKGLFFCSFSLLFTPLIKVTEIFYQQKMAVIGCAYALQWCLSL